MIPSLRKITSTHVYTTHVVRAEYSKETFRLCVSLLLSTKMTNKEPATLWADAGQRPLLEARQRYCFCRPHLQELN
jgi:hypothetical protein